MNHSNFDIIRRAVDDDFDSKAHRAARERQQQNLDHAAINDQSKGFFQNQARFNQYEEDNMMMRQLDANFRDQLSDTRSPIYQSKSISGPDSESTLINNFQPDNINVHTDNQMHSFNDDHYGKLNEF